MDIPNIVSRIKSLYRAKKLYLPILSVILFRITLDILYILVINTAWSYYFMELNLHAYKYIISWIPTLLMSPIIIKLYKNSSLSSTVVLLLNLIYFIPGCSLYALAGLDDWFFVYYILYWAALTVWQEKLPYIYFRRFNKEDVSRKIFYGIIAFVVMSAVVITGIYNGFKINIDLFNVSQLRVEQRLMNLPAIVGYLQPLAAAILPLAIIWFLFKKIYILVAVITMVQVLLFSFGGMRVTLFMLPVAILGYYFYREKRVNWFSWGLTALNLLAVVEYFTTKSLYISAYIQNRNMLLPNIISSQYFEFFSKHQPDYLMQGVARRFGFISHYADQIPRMIGFEYFHNIETNANNGMVGDAFSNFSWLGILIFPLILVLALRVMDACAHGIDRRFLISVIVIYTISFINGAFFSVLLTNGFLFMCITLYFMPRDGAVLHSNLGKTNTSKVGELAE